jgi:hypothetical protein
MKQHFKFAVDNIAKFGDTDVFPYPIENHIFFDKPNEVVEILDAIHKDFDSSLLMIPPVYAKSLSVVGYSGFRPATQIDPIWNAYLLALVLSIGNEIEIARVPTARNTVFSYRFKPDETNRSIFNLEIGWQTYQKTCVEHARKHAYVMACDISDFYPRIYHHRLENALKKASTNTECIRRIMELLKRISEGASYGLPVGGPAARLLSELLLNRIDRLLIAEGVTFCRFVDDFHLFAASREEAYGQLVSFSELLLANEGLSLQKAKTKIMSREEFLSTSFFAEENEPESEEDLQTRKFIGLRLKYDPYSPTADEDYEALRDELQKFDIVGMLAREIRKTRIDESLTRKLIRAIKFLEPKIRNQAVISLTDSFPVLYPVFTSVMILIKSIIDDIDKSTRTAVFQSIRNLIKQGSYITRVPANLAFAIRVLAHDDSEETDAILAALYKEPVNMMIKRDIILIMAKRNSDYWISNCRKQYSVITPWERRALLIASYILEDEGKHWREAIKKEVTPMDRVAMDWAAEKKNVGSWDVPI